jgi:RNA polymerase sigma-70 factor (ECF subfamily)
MPYPDVRDANRVVADIARESYARLLAWLAYQWRNVAAAEDALGAALTKALVTWPERGIPDSPEAWLLCVAKRELLQTARQQRLHNSPEVQAVLETAEVSDGAICSVPDHRLKLLFICAHPAIDISVRPALMLQTVLGLESQWVAQAMLTSPVAMAQRLVRAKHKIRDAQLRFEEPNADELPERLHSVLEAIYAAYGLGWDAVNDGEQVSVSDLQGMRAEALFLGRMVCQLLPQEPEALGLLALMHFCEARTVARFGPQGDFIPLPDQNTALWNREEINFAEQCLREAARIGSAGPFQLEAAIQSAHSQRLFTQETPWHAIADLYEQLVTLTPSLGARVAYAVALAHAGNVKRSQADLDALVHPRLVNYQPYWVAKAYVAQLQGRSATAVEYTHRAVGLTSSPSIRMHLLTKLNIAQ